MKTKKSPQVHLERMAVFMGGIPERDQIFHNPGFRFSVAPDGRSKWWHKDALKYASDWNWLIPVLSKWSSEASYLYHKGVKMPEYTGYRETFIKYVIENDINPAFLTLSSALEWLETHKSNEVSR